MTFTASSTGTYTSHTSHFQFHCVCVCVYRQLIYNYPEQLFADAGIMAIEHADFEGIERLALVLGGSAIFHLSFLSLETISDTLAHTFRTPFATLSLHLSLSLCLSLSHTCKHV